MFLRIFVLRPAFVVGVIQLVNTKQIRPHLQRYTNHSEYQQLKPISQLQFDCDTTTTWLQRKIDMLRRSQIVVVSQSNRTHIVISITSIVVECVVVSSHRSRIVVESQLWYRLTIRLRSNYDISCAPASIRRNSTRAKKWTCQFFVIVVS